MDVTNKKYSNQGIHAIAAIFTIENDGLSALLIKRKKEPYKGKWILTGGAVYNDETVEEGLAREIYEKTGLKDLYYEQFGVFSNPNRSPLMRMVAIAYIALIDIQKVKILKETSHTQNAEWFNINEIPKLGYDHEKILNEGLAHLKKIILKSNIVKVLLPDKFTMPQLQKIYETLLNNKYDRRNFRKKLLSLGLLEETEDDGIRKVGKPAKYYRFKQDIVEKSIF
ncbi:MAG: NUDIX domain-containing protein [Bacilli bacterium]|nr:NUDIX domain-containing protein [Bacilli bacterium]MDD4298737.1 NUDIX domain-containing protein [Bacilli bacterium]MDD4643653.1 NUDIX domain-containing protein [Bacilli bacterium]